MLLDVARVFCQNTSIRGVGKIFKAPSACLRALWLIYVLSMLAFLIFSTSRIFKDYLEYSTVIQTSWGMNDKSIFPSITFCNHYSFSKQAKEQWSKRAIMSPGKWNSFLRRRLKKCMGDDDYICGINNFLDDTKRMYYQNLSPNESVKIGHRLEDTILLCVVFRGSMLNSGSPEECGINVTTISLANYFNCFTVQPGDHSQIQVDRLILVLNVGEKPDFANHEQAFITDIFEQAHGVRMVVHEPGTYPDIQARGDQVEPGKMVEVSYQPIRVKEVKTPKKPCYEDENETPKIQDLNKEYKYTLDACISMKTSAEFLKRCRCYFADYLRPGVPNQTYPYCGEIMNTPVTDFTERRRCMSMVDRKSLTSTLEDSICHRRCKYYRYSTRTSITKWRFTQWQVYWARKQLQALNKLYEASTPNSTKGMTEKERLHAIQDIKDYTDSKNLTIITEKSNFSKHSQSIPAEPDDFVYIVLSRQKSPTMLEVNKLTLTLNGLVSRIGGLCSLYLGLTCAFGVELIEFLYLMKQRLSQPKEKPSNGKDPTLNQEPRASENNNTIGNEPMLTNRYSPMYGMISNIGDREHYKTDDESPWTPRVPLNSTSL